MPAVPPRRFRVLYVFEERIPVRLRDMIFARLAGAGFEVDAMTYQTPEPDQCRKMAWADGVFFGPGRKLPAAVFEAARGVGLMQIWSSGYDKFDVAAATRHGIPVANNGGANAVSVAEHTVLLMLAVYKSLPDSHRRTVEGRWAGNSHGMDMFLLQGKTLGVIGFGKIGRAVAERAAAFGMRIVYVDPTPAPGDVEARLGAVRTDLGAALAAADVLTLHLHLGPETREMIGPAELARMKPGAVLINVSRAELVDYQALYAALERRHLRGAGLDVYYAEPTAAGDLLLNHPGVVATPHMAGSTYDAYVAGIENCAANLERVARGERPLWVVNGVAERRHARARP
jgi:phosphoglycerate dehydrogenase-like enzyme